MDRIAHDDRRRNSCGRGRNSIRRIRPRYEIEPGRHQLAVGVLDRSLGDALPPSWQKKALRLAILLRLAVLLNRSRSTSALPPLTVTARKHELRMAFPAGWLAANPLTVADLERERDYLDAVGYRLLFT